MESWERRCADGLRRRRGIYVGSAAVARRRIVVVEVAVVMMVRRVVGGSDSGVGDQVVMVCWWELLMDHCGHSMEEGKKTVAGEGKGNARRDEAGRQARREREDW